MKLKVQKCNPLVDAKPYYVEGEIEYREGVTELDAVYLFHTEVEPVSFDYSCGGRVCGRCGAMVDGEPKLMCFALLDDSEHVLEPLEGFDVIRDLVVGKSDFDRRIAELDSRVMVEPVTAETLTSADFDAEMVQIALKELDWYDKGDRVAQAVSSGLYHCIQCGTCDEVCTIQVPHLKIWKLLRGRARGARPGAQLREVGASLSWFRLRRESPQFPS